MHESIYNALFGAMTQEQRMNTIANNLANADTVGFKRDKQAFKDVYAKYWHNVSEWTPSIRSKPLFPEPEVFAQNRVAITVTDFTPGSLRQTGNPLDVAINGEGLFKVRMNNDTYYTRNGCFKVDENGTLLTQGGYEVLGQGGAPIQIPRGSKVTINEGGQIFADGNQVGALDVVGVNDTIGLEKVGHNLLQPRAGYKVEEQPLQNPAVSQGFLETSNVSVVEEMVNMIDTSRVYETYQKIMTTTQDNDKKSINDVGLTR